MYCTLVTPCAHLPARLALCGTSGRITLAFPFNQFNPPEQEVHFKAVVS